MESRTWKQGDVDPGTGKVYWGRRSTSKDGFLWMTPESFARKKEQVAAARRSEKGRAAEKARRNTDAERAKRNAYDRKRRAETAKGRGLDLRGQVYGRLTVLAVAGSKTYGTGNYHGAKKRMWLCQCECGKTTEVPTVSLTKTGGTRSCGCLHSEAAVANSKKSRHAILKPDAPLNYLVNVYKNGAKARGIEWGLTKEECRTLFAGDCHYCGAAPSNKARSRTSVFLYNGIDRVQNSGGYTPSNVVSCCGICNHAKHTLSSEEFVGWALRLAAHQAKGAAR